MLGMIDKFNSLLFYQLQGTEEEKLGRGEYCNLFHTLGDCLFKMNKTLVASTITDALEALQILAKHRCLIPRR